MPGAYPAWPQGPSACVEVIIILLSLRFFLQSLEGFFFQNPSSFVLSILFQTQRLFATQQVAFHTREHLFLIMNKIVARNWQVY